jgi:hypothetical protein
MNSKQREQIWIYIKNSEKVINSKSIEVKYRESITFDDEYLIITIVNPEQYGYFKYVHVTLWKKPWVKNGAFHFVSGLDKAPQWQKDLYGYFKMWYQIFNNNEEISIRKYTGSDVKETIILPRNDKDEKYIKYKEGIDKIKIKYFTVIKYLIKKSVEE